MKNYFLLTNTVMAAVDTADADLKDADLKDADSDDITDNITNNTIFNRDSAHDSHLICNLLWVRGESSPYEYIMDFLRDNREKIILKCHTYSKEGGTAISGICGGNAHWVANTSFMNLDKRYDCFCYTHRMARNDALTREWIDIPYECDSDGEFHEISPMVKAAGKK